MKNRFEQMKTTLSHYIYTLIAFVALLSPACTRNNGDIGHWFGVWRMETLEINGVTDPDYTSPRLIWKFQSDIVFIGEPDDALHIYHGTAYGNWSQDGDYLLLDFDKEMGNFSDTLHLPLIAKLKILKLTSREIELQYTDNDNNTYYYKLKKWG